MIDNVADNHVIIYKKVGETPLEALERYRAEQVSLGRGELLDMPMTYAGRLDPMAEGELIILIGEECKQKEKYLGLDKEYEVEVLFGVETDTYDVLGLVIRLIINTDYKEKYSIKRGQFGECRGGGNMSPRHILESDGKSVTSRYELQGRTFSLRTPDKSDTFFVTSAYIGKYTGKFIQEYPPYSSKTVNGKQLHELARSNELPDEIPTKKVEIYSIEELGRRVVHAFTLKKEILEKIDLVKGDFRQEEIKKRWEEVLDNSMQTFELIKIKVTCSSGTYMRSLAHTMGKDRGTRAIALSIKRTKILLTR